MVELRCREDAEHCERMAAIMLTKAQRDSYLELANMWRKLAEETVRHRQRVEAWTKRTRTAPELEPDDARPEPALAFGRE
jgi:hypothetical protein